MRIVIDAGLCTGNGRCYLLFPGLFTDDDRGYGKVIGEVSIGDDQLAQARRVVVACPEQAITIEDE
jgi:ferredoxin